MDAPRFDALTKAWTRLPRRRVLGRLVAGALGPLLGQPEASAKSCRRSRDCPSGQRCVHHTCTAKCDDPLTCESDGSQVGGTVAASSVGALAAPSPVAAVLQQAAICNPTPNSNFSSSGNPRFAATFVAGLTGKLSRVEIRVNRAAGFAGDFVVKLLAVDQFTGVPKNKVLARRTVPVDSVPAGQDVTVIARFKKRRTTKLVQGKQYAVVISRPKADATQWSTQIALGNPCPDSRFFFSSQQSGALEEPPEAVDMLFTVFVGF